MGHWIPAFGCGGIRMPPLYQPKRYAAGYCGLPGRRDALCHYTTFMRSAQRSGIKEITEV